MYAIQHYMIKRNRISKIFLFDDCQCNVEKSPFIKVHRVTDSPPPPTPTPTSTPFVFFYFVFLLLFFSLRSTLVRLLVK